MKKFAMSLALLIGFSSSALAAQGHIVTLQDGSQVAVHSAACWNPDTGRLEPCFLTAPAAPAAAQENQDACYDPVTKRWEPCY